MLNGLRELQSISLDSVKSARNENAKLNSMVSKIIPVASRIMNFESIDQAKKLEDLYNEVATAKPSLDDSSRTIEGALLTLRNYGDSKKRDTERIIIVSQYPLVKNYISRTLRENESLPVTKMPFQKNVALMYLRLYAESVQSVTYDDELEEIRNDKMR